MGRLTASVLFLMLLMMVMMVGIVAKVDISMLTGIMTMGTTRKVMVNVAAI